MGVTGPTSSLERLARKLREIDRTLAKTPRDLASKAAELTRISANAQRSPEGAAWQRGPATSPQIGRKSGVMLGSIRGSGSGLTFSVRVGRRYAWFFQHGAVHRGAIEGSAGRLRTGKNAGRGKSGPRGRPQQGPLRKGRERGFQQPRHILPGAAIPPAWRAPLESVIDTRLRRDLAL